MAYKKYIVKNGKTYGPYLYHSRRVNGKVVSEYHGSKTKLNYKKIFLFLGGFIGIAILIYFLFSLNLGPSGKATFDMSADYQKDQPLDGVLRLALKKGELLPASTKIIFTDSAQKYEYTLSEILTQETTQGDYYAEGKTLTGNGEGYGTPGAKETYPTISFVLESYTEKTSEKKEKEPKEKEETPPEPKQEETPEEESTQEPIEKPIEEEPIEPEESEAEEETTEEPEEQEEPQETEEPTPEPEPEETPEPESPPETSDEAPITGGVIARIFGGISNFFLGLTGTGQVSLEFENEIQGEVSKGNPFTYELEPGQTIEIKSSSQDINLEIENNIATVTTEYSEEQEGFGEEYLEDETETLEIDLAQLNLILEQGDLEIKLVYEQEEIISLTTTLTDGESISEATEEPQAPTEIINKTETNIAGITNQTTNQTIETNITNATEVTEVKYALTDEEKEILINEFGEIIIKTTKAEKVNNRIIIKHELGNYWVEHSYDESTENLEAIMETDKIKWLKDIVKELTKQQSSSQELEGYLGEFGV